MVYSAMERPFAQAGKRMNLEEEIAASLSQAIAKEIDFEIISDLLISSGWTKVVLRPMTWETGADIDLWVEQNCKGKYQTMGLVWIFEDASDASWFTLRWMC